MSEINCEICQAEEVDRDYKADVFMDAMRGDKKSIIQVLKWTLEEIDGARQSIEGLIKSNENS